jgi:hypothetical protein
MILLSIEADFATVTPRKGRALAVAIELQDRFLADFRSYALVTVVLPQTVELLRARRGAVGYILRHARRNWREEAKPTRSATHSISRLV